MRVCVCLTSPKDPTSVRSMRKHTTLDLDQDLVREAAVALGTSRITETVHAALAEVVARRRRAVLARLEFPDLTPGALAAMRAPRRFDTPAEKPAAPAEEPAPPDESASPLSRAR
jgi:Arc/MetJ family transcription regulator